MNAAAVIYAAVVKEEPMYDRKTQKIAFGGIAVALVIISLYGGTIIKNNKVFFMAFAIIFTAIPYIIGGIRYGLTSYFSAVILAIILIPNIMYAGVYAVFGTYPLIKLLAERKNIIISYIIKLLWFNISVALVFYTFSQFIYINTFFQTNLGKILFVISLQAVVPMFDFLFNRSIYFFINRISKGVE